MRYRTIVADPPWAYHRNPTLLTRVGRQPKKSGVAEQYPTMTLREIEALPVHDLADTTGCHLYLWTTNPFLPNAFDVMDAWGFRYITTITWVKQGHLGLGHHFRVQTEHVLFGVIGTLRTLDRSQTNVVTAPKRGHSIKPDAFMDMVERMSPAPRIELFARRNRLGWDTWGNEALEHVELTS